MVPFTGTFPPLLRAGTDSHQGSYLLNLSTFDSGMEEIFGPPIKVIEYANPLTEYGRGGWGCGYWWKFFEQQ